MYSTKNYLRGTGKSKLVNIHVFSDCHSCCRSITRHDVYNTRRKTSLENNTREMLAHQTVHYRPTRLILTFAFLQGLSLPEHLHIERFSMKCRKTKTEGLTTLANHKAQTLNPVNHSKQINVADTKLHARKRE